MNQKPKHTHGGRRPGAGNPGTKRVAECKATFALSIKPSIMLPFKKKFGKLWMARIQQFIEEDLRNNTTS